MTVVDSTLLWCPARTNVETSAAWTDWQSSQQWQWPGLGLAKWSVPAVGSINWAANPYSNLTWFMYFQGLTFLLAPSYGIINGASAATYAPLIRDYILSWIANCTPAAVPLAWTEEMLPRRVAVIAYLYHRHLRGTAYIDAGQEAAILASMDYHAGLLSALIDDPQYAAHNHGYMHRLALYNTCVAWANELTNATTLRAKARTGMINTGKALFSSPSGACIEQATAYHYVDLAFIEEGVNLCANFSEPLTSDPDTQTLMTAAVRWGALVPMPNGTQPALGDTGNPLGWDSTLINRLRATLDSPVAQFAATKGNFGDRPESSYFWPDSGYALIRPQWSGGDWENDLHVMIGCWLAIYSHGHGTTGGHFTLYSNGSILLDDSGGPFVYGDAAASAYFVSPQAHNVLHINGATWTSVTATVVASGTLAGVSWLTLTHTGYAGCTVERTIVVDHESRAVVVLDSATCDQVRDIDVHWHLPIAAVLSDDGSRKVSTVGKAKLGVSVVGLPSSVVQGVNTGAGNAEQGWISTSYLTRSPAPVLRYRKTGSSARFVSVLQPAAQADDFGAVSVSENAGDVVVKIGKRTLVINRLGASALGKKTMNKYRRIAAETREVEKFIATMSAPTGCTQALAPESSVSGGAVRMTVNAATNNAYFDRSTTSGHNLKAGGQVSVIVKIEGDIPGTAALRFNFSQQPIFNGSEEFDATNLKKGWNVVRRRCGPGAGWTTRSGGVVDWGNIQYMRYQAVNLPGQVLIWDHTYYGGFHKAAIIVGLDGGYGSQASFGINACNAAGLTGVYFAPTPENIGTTSYSSTDAIAALAATGVEILGKVGASVSTAKALSDQYSGSGVVWAATPTDADIIAAGTAKWGCFRSAGENYVSAFGNLNPLRHYSYNLGGVTLATAKARVDTAIAGGELLIFSVPALVAGGNIGTAPADTSTWYADDLALLAQYIADAVRKGLCDSPTPRAWLKSVA